MAEATVDREALREQVLAVVEEHISDCLDDPAGRDVDTESEVLTDSLLAGPLAEVLAENERLRAGLDKTLTCNEELAAERNALAAKVAAAEALCDEWDAMGPGRSGYATALRAALDTPEGEQ